MNDHELAASLAHEAGRLLLRVRAQGGAAGDRQSNALLVGRLTELRGGDAVLSEESPDDLGRLEADRVWIIDPLDGTREYGEPPRRDWAVHVGLAVNGEPVAGAVALPAQGLVLSSGANRAGAPPKRRALRLAVSRTRPPACVDSIAAALDAQVVPMGSAGAKAMAVVMGEVDAYVHSGGQFEWDSCAPVAVALAAGLHATRLDGSALRYNAPNPHLPDLVICKPDIADRVISAAAELGR